MIEEIKGLRELNDFLQGVPVKMETRILRGAIRAGSKVIADDARIRAPILRDPDPRRVPGALRKSIRVMSTILKGGAVLGGVAAGGRANVKRGRIRGLVDAFYAKFVEYGTARTAARPFLRPALDSKGRAAVDATATYIRGRIDAGDLK